VALRLFGSSWICGGRVGMSTPYDLSALSRWQNLSGFNGALRRPEISNTGAAQ
jgi:hypothetical protein